MANRLTIDKTTFSVGDTVRVFQKIKEKDKTRIQPFEGIVISIKGKGENKMFTIRKIAAGGIGVERIWPAVSSWIEKIVVKKRGKVRRAKLYYLRKRVGKKAIKIKAKREKPLSKAIKRDDHAERGKNHTERDEKEKPRQSRRKPRSKTSEK